MSNIVRDISGINAKLEGMHLSSKTCTGVVRVLYRSNSNSYQCVLDFYTGTFGLVLRLDNGFIII